MFFKLSINTTMRNQTFRTKLPKIDGWYAEAAYDVMPLLWTGTTQYLAPFFRYEQLDTVAEAPTGFADDPSRDREIFQGGLSYKPIPNVVIKADYRNFEAKAGDRADEFNLGLGFIF
jgi:hypothetical protein